MPKFLLHRKRYVYVIAFGAIALIGLLLLTWHLVYIGLTLIAILAGIGYKLYQAEENIEDEFENYITTLTYRVKKVGEDIVSDLPVGIILYDEDRTIQWHNKYLNELLQLEQSPIGNELHDVLPKLQQVVDSEERETYVRFGDMSLALRHHPEERRIYLYDQTQYYQLQIKHRQGKTVFLQLHLDNLDEVSQGLDEQSRTLLLSDVTQTIDQWGKDNGIYLRRTSADKFFGVLTEQKLKKLEENRFEILDIVRELTNKNSKIPITLSIGVGASSDDFIDLGHLAQSSLDISLGRGGDQAAVKRGTGKITFFGGKSNAVEKRTRVRARVISHALSDLIQESDKVFVMGHTNPDMDSVGSAIGVVKAVQANHKDAYVVLDLDESAPGVERLLNEIKEHEEIYQYFVTPSEALDMKTEHSLLVIVDVHKPSLVIEDRLVEHIHRKVVIDHHRRGEEFISEPLLVYMEPYASSTSELVSELLEYQDRNISMSKLEATAMLAGIVVDTNSFAFRTGSRTFEAASYLRHHGADTSLVQKLMKEDIDHFVERAKIVAGAEFYRDHIAIAVAETPVSSQVLMAQAADTLLTMKNVGASFVINQRQDGLIAISARSLGEMNVQVIMERMGGGGHLTNAATQIEDATIEETLQSLKSVIDDYLEGGETE
ncbi:DHH family phosphoesterase [Caldalkalibacillus salinus]|uniref:DHH family phosphoesterase n=1 Tax=Caldalkalibacillus salinus TaxID=2803787 RepID=UPI0019228B53|nr:DHH family phosphoesterase [Caldalkalibacillus salinus]